jgi:putative endonuclease
VVVIPAQAGISNENKKAMNNQFYVYILTNKGNTVLYVGVTNNLKRRVYEHKTHLNSGFTDKYNICKLIWYDCFLTPDNAILREKQLKKWNRTWKERIINEMNPEWKDLSMDWYNDLEIPACAGMTAKKERE